MYVTIWIGNLDSDKFTNKATRCGATPQTFAGDMKVVYSRCNSCPIHSNTGCAVILA